MSGGAEWPDERLGQLGEIGTIPIAAPQEAMGLRHRLNAAVESLHETFHRHRSKAGQMGDGTDIREHVLNAVIEFGHQKLLPLLGLLAGGDVQNRAHQAMTLPAFRPAQMEQAPTIEQPMHRPIRAKNAELLFLPVGFAIPEGVHGEAHALAVVGMDEAEKVP